MTYTSECRSSNKNEEIKTKVTKTRTLRWKFGVTKSEGIRNEYIKSNLGLTGIAENMRENRQTVWTCLKRNFPIFKRKRSEGRGNLGER